MKLGDLTVHRLGFGALRLKLSEREASKAILRHAVDRGVTFIDTADSYHLGQNEELIAEALHPYADNLVIGTKAGQAHPGDEWIPLGRPEYLRQQAELSLRRLRLDRIDLYQLHRVDPKVPLEDQVGAFRQLQDEGKVRHVGLSEVTVDQLEAARRITPIVSVQNLYNLSQRHSENVLDHCEANGIAFLPWLPVQPSARTPDSVLERVARTHGVSTTRVALAWLLARSPVMLPIPGTSKLAHLDDNLAAVDLRLTEEDAELLDGLPVHV
jgi:pyridoxine 4-dehydrogenase